MLDRFCSRLAGGVIVQLVRASSACVVSLAWRGSSVEKSVQRGVGSCSIDYLAHFHVMADPPADSTSQPTNQPAMGDSSAGASQPARVFRHVASPSSSTVGLSASGTHARPTSPAAGLSASGIHTLQGTRYSRPKVLVSLTGETDICDPSAPS